MFGVRQSGSAGLFMSADMALLKLTHDLAREAGSELTELARNWLKKRSDLIFEAN